MTLPAYWISNMLFDIIKALIPCGIVIGLLSAFDFFYPEVWRVFLMYPLGLVPFTYVTSFLFESDTVAQTVTIFFHFVLAGIGAITTYILRIIEQTWVIGDRMHWWMKLVPSFCLTNPVMYMSSKDRLFSARLDLKVDSNLDISLVGGELYALLAHCIGWTIILIIIEAGALRWISQIPLLLPKNRIKPKTVEELYLDEDVLQEEERVKKDNMDTVRVQGFRKVYSSVFRPPVVAVERTSFGLTHGECFALLGVNGAGKTTTFRALTSQERTIGTLTLGGRPLSKDFSYVRMILGYCPQYDDGLISLLTVEEHLWYYT
jgi:ATP-binding cassette subfamily A (ABC1) protein 3